MSVAIGHEHDEVCDARAANGRTSTTIAIRIHDTIAVQLRELVANSHIGTSRWATTSSA